MTPDPSGLFQQIGDQGDFLWRGKLPERDAVGEIPADEEGPLEWSLLYLTGVALERHPEVVWAWPLVLLFFFPMFAFDVAHFVLRCAIYPLAWAAWWIERRVALCQGRGYLCPVCHKLTDDPWPCCPNPKCRRRVQPRLRPRFNSLFLRRCLACGRGRWWVLGQRFWRPPRLLVCRHADGLSGCYHLLRIPALEVGNRVKRVAIVGTTVPSKHSAMSHLFLQLTAAAPGRETFAPSWRVSQLELQLCKALLYRAAEMDTTAYETPGKRYSLCWTLVLRATRRNVVLVFHNLLNRWFDNTHILAEKCTDWKRLDALLLVLDGVAMAKQEATAPLPQAETYSRVVRVVEEQCNLRPGQSLPFKVAVLFGARPDEVPSFQEASGSGEGLPSETAEAFVRKYDPALLALLQRTVSAGRLRFFCGPLPPEPNVEDTVWMRELLRWVC